jgi:hypothetical protein
MSQSGISPRAARDRRCCDAPKAQKESRTVCIVGPSGRQLKSDVVEANGQR